MVIRQKVDTALLFKLWHDNVPIVAIRRQLKISDARLRQLITTHKLPARPRKGGKKREIDPTPEEIEAILLETRRGWTEKEADERYGGPKKRKDWSIPTYHYDGQTGLFSRE